MPMSFLMAHLEHSFLMDVYAPHTRSKPALVYHSSPDSSLVVALAYTSQHCDH